MGLRSAGTTAGACLPSACCSALFTNDGAALILTSIVISMLLALRFSRAPILAFVMAAGFIADTASLPLVVSNRVNIVSADYFHLGFSEYAAVMVPVNLASITGQQVLSRYNAGSLLASAGRPAIKKKAWPTLTTGHAITLN